LVVRRTELEFRRGYNKLLKDRNVVVVEDIITTGGSVRKTIEAARRAGGSVTGVYAFCNRGGVAAAQLGIPYLYSLVDVQMDAFDEGSCPLCAQGVPINTEVGKGKDFLARKSAAQ